MELSLNSWLISLLLPSVITALLIKHLITFLKKLWLLPPGPWGLPIVGYLPWMSQAPYLAFTELSKRYGGLFSVKLGQDTVVVLNDWPTIKATLVDQKKIFSGRPNKFILVAAANRKDISLSDGPVWSKQRRLTIQCLRNIGMGKKSTESIVTGIVHQLLDKLTKLDDQIVPMESFFFGPIFRVNWGMVSGDNVCESEVSVEETEVILTEVVSGLGSNNLVDAFPWLRFLQPNGFGFHKFQRTNNMLKNMIRKMITEHIDQWKEGFEVDLVDHYITAIMKHKTENKVEEPPYNVDHLVGTLWDLFLGGSATGNATCQWGFLHIASNPEVQKKAQAELDSVVGTHRLINLNDFPKLPYLEALIMEVHRMASVVPLSVPHSTVQDHSMHGYTIPKGMTCLQNIYAVHHDPNLFEQPEVFRPERFLDMDKPVWPPYLMPLSIGARKCLGESVAEMELKLIFGGLLQKFNFSLPENQPKDIFQPVFGMVLHPKPYSLHIKIRN